MKKNQYIGVLIILSILFFSANRPYSPTTVPKANQELVIISTKEAYLSDIQKDSQRKMVLLKDYITPLVTDFQYADTANFTHVKLYDNPMPYLRMQPALALQKINKELKVKGLGLKIFDAYRPYAVTKKMWEVVPDERYAANPAKGSGHNRGAAIDITLFDLKTGKELPMPTPFDNFTEQAHHSYMQLPENVIKNRKLLRDVMEQYGFIALETEWWHYSWPNAAQLYPILDFDFKEMKELVKK